MTAERHIAIPRAVIRAKHQQDIAVPSSDLASAGRLTAEADRLQQRRLP